MKVLVLGSGGRETAICRALHGQCELSAAPGNLGMEEFAECFDISLENINNIVKLAQQIKADMVICGPEKVLSLGVTDALESCGIKCCGPSIAAAQLECSKVFMKKLALNNNIPSPQHYVINSSISYDEIERLIYGFKDPPIIKEDGLKGGKGVYLSKSHHSAFTRIKTLLSGKTEDFNIIIEKQIKGFEASFFYACREDGSILPLSHAMDYKRRYKHSETNTGGMGAISPHPLVDYALENKVLNKIVNPTLSAMASKWRPFKGFLYAGIMVVDGEPQLLEFNVRLGDPEAQALLPRIKNFLSICKFIVGNSTLSDPMVLVEDFSTCAVVLSNNNYPMGTGLSASISNYEHVGIRNDKTSPSIGDRWIDISNVEQENHYYISNAGRILSMVSIGENLKNARTLTYSGMRILKHVNASYRMDIGETDDSNANVSIIMGSKSDMPVVEKCCNILNLMGISYDLNVLSAHRMPKELVAHLNKSKYKVIVAAAGLSAALPGVCASHTDIPVIGLPIQTGALQGVDALLSIAQMPPGVPVATVGINGAKNAAYMAARILALSDKNVKKRLKAVMEDDYVIARIR